MLFKLFSLVALLATASAAPAGKLSVRDDFDSCVANSKGSICSPVNDSPTMAIGDHINLSLVATGVDNSTGISTKLRSKKTGKITQLKWLQRNASGYEYGDRYYSIVTSHNGGIFYGNLGKAFTGDGQLPCSLFDDNPGGQGEFEWLLTHYFGERCAYDRSHACYPLLFDLPPFSGPRKILLKDNAEVCGR